jgi:hypothetical protein
MSLKASYASPAKWTLPSTRGIFGYAMWHRRYVGKIGTLEAVQCVWPDKAGLFPGEPGCDAEVEALQPDLTLYRDEQPEG